MVWNSNVIKRLVGKALSGKKLQVIIRLLWNFWPDLNDILCKYVKEFRNFSCLYKWDLEALGLS